MEINKKSKIGAITFELIHHNYISLQTWIQLGASLLFHLLPFKNEFIDKCCGYSSNSKGKTSSIIVYEDCKFELMSVKITKIKRDKF